MYRQRRNAMIFPIILGILIILTACFWIREGWDDETTQGLFIASCVVTAIVLLITGAAMSSNYSTFQDLKVMDNKIAVYENKRDALMEQYTALLDSNYREYETEIVSKMIDANKSISNSKSDVSVNVLPQYPELKYQNSIESLAKEINKLNSTIYDLQIETQDLIAEIKVYHGNIWLPSFLYWNVSEDCEKYELIEPVQK